MQHPKTRTTGTVTKPNNSGPKAVDHRWQRSPTSEPQKKRAAKAPDLETQVARLQEELKNTKNQLSQSESCTKQARQEAEEYKKELAAMNAKLDELWACEEAKIQELRKISQDRDRAWESELQAVQKHLATAINENQKLNNRLQKMAQSEAEQTKQAELAQEVLTLRLQLSESVNEVKEVKNKLNESKECESRALEELESVKSGRVEDLGTALAEKAEMEGELKRLKVQMEQWRKAAEVAAAMVLGEVSGGGKFEESTESLDVNVIGEKLNSGYLEYTEDESSIKKTSNVLKKFGVLLKMGQK